MAKPYFVYLSISHEGNLSGCIDDYIIYPQGLSIVFSSQLCLKTENEEDSPLTRLWQRRQDSGKTQAKEARLRQWRQNSKTLHIETGKHSDHVRVDPVSLKSTLMLWS